MYIHMIVRNCKKWIIASETLYRTNVQQSVVSNCVDLTHHFILKYTAYYYYIIIILVSTKSDRKQIPKLICQLFTHCFILELILDPRWGEKKTIRISFCKNYKPISTQKLQVLGKI